MGCPTGSTMVDDIPVAVSFKRTWTLSTLVVLSDGRLYVNVAESFLTPLNWNCTSWWFNCFTKIKNNFKPERHEIFKSIEEKFFK